MSESAGARRLPTVAVVILVAAVVGVAGLVAGSALTSAGERVSRPAEGSAEAGFARDMQTHHLQKCVIFAYPLVGDCVIWLKLQTESNLLWKCSMDMVKVSDHPGVSYLY